MPINTAAQKIHCGAFSTTLCHNGSTRVHYNVLLLLPVGTVDAEEYKVSCLRAGLLLPVAIIVGQ